MTDRIDLDELDSETDSEETPNRGDWFWKGESDPDDQPQSETIADADELSSGASNTRSEAERQRVPHVPRSNEGKPAGIPVEQGGSGGGAVGDSRDRDEGDVETVPASSEEASGPHGQGADDMTLAMSYEATKRLANPEVAFAEAAEWADWVGIVGDVDAPVINKFQRDSRLDLDFFNGTGTGPGERLSEVDEFSMFFADRMVFVGVEGEEHIAEAADWEFVSLTEAAEAASWEFRKSRERDAG